MLKDINLGSLAGKLWGDFKYFLSNPIPMSFSKMSTYQTCAYKYKLIYIDRQPGKPSPYLAFGTVMHDTFFEFESIPHGVKREYMDLERIFQRNWDKEIGTYQRKWGKSIYELIAAEKNSTAGELEKDAYAAGHLMLKNYWRESQTNPNKVRGVEKWLFGEIGHYHVTGRLDRLDQRPDGSYEIIDYKTGQRIYTEDSLKDASKSYGLQAGLYYEMCREAWRDRVDRFVFKYLQKQQSFAEYLVTTWLGSACTAARDAIAAGSSSAATPATADLAAARTSAVHDAIRAKLEDKIARKVVYEGEEDRVREAIRKIRLDEEDEFMSAVSADQRKAARLFLKTLNKALETRINEEIAKAVQTPAVTARYESEVRRVISETLKTYDEARVGAAVHRFLTDIESDYGRRAGGQVWPKLPSSERERITTEIFEMLYHRDVKARTEASLKKLSAEALHEKARSRLKDIPDIRADRHAALVRHVLESLRASFPQHLDVYPADEIARLISETAPQDMLTDEHIRRTEKMLDALVEKSGVRKSDSGRTLSDGQIAAARRKILLLPLANAIKAVVFTCIEETIADIRSERSDVLTPALRERYRQILATLSESAALQIVATKLAGAYANLLFHETYFKQGVVPVVDHVTRLFERPDVMNAIDRLTPGLGETERRQKAQRLIEKLDWRDAEALTEDALNPGLAAWRDVLLSLIRPAVQAAGAAGGSAKGIQETLDAAAELFENRTSRVTTLDVEVPYTPDTRVNVLRAIEQVQEGLRRRDFTPSRGALCGWCEYQSGCPAWCKYRDICRNECKDAYNCKKWFNETTGRLVEGRPPDMTREEYLRRIADKYEVTDKSLFRLSFSKMNSYELCPMNYRKLYLDHVSPKPKSFFSIGLSYHQTMEDLYAYTGPRKQPSLKMLIDLFKKKWISAGYRSREEENFNFRRGLRMCEDYYAEYIDGKYQPAGAAEDYFEFKIGRTLLCGFIDRVDLNPDGTITIIDYKTNPKLYTQEELEEDQQMTIYYLAAREGKLSSTNYRSCDVKHFAFQFVNFCKDLVTYRKPADLETLMDRVTHFTAEMEWRQKVYKEAKFDPRVGMLLFPPQDNKYCQSCDHHHICPLKTDMTLTGEIQKKGVNFEDAVDAKEFMDEATERVATVDAE